MRIAVVSDIHGNLTAFEAVLADLRDAAPDQVIHGGDLGDGGCRPVEIIDAIRALGWPGAMGNGDQMLSCPQSLETFARGSSAPPALWDAVRSMAAAVRSMLGAERLCWLDELPLSMTPPGLAVVHASPGSCWKAPPAKAIDADLQQIYAPLGRPVVVFCHTHLPAVRPMTGPVELLINTGSVGLPFDGDPRASYLLLDDGAPTIRRVPYDVDKEVHALQSRAFPHADWVARMLRTAAPQMP